MAFTPESGDIWIKRSKKSLQFHLDDTTYDVAPGSTWLLAGENILAGRAISIATQTWADNEVGVIAGRAYYTDTYYVEKSIGIALNDALAGEYVNVRGSGLYEWSGTPPFDTSIVSTDIGKIAYIAQTPDGEFTLDRVSAALGGSAIVEVGVLTSLTSILISLEGDGKGLNNSQLQYIAGETITFGSVPVLVTQKEAGIGAGKVFKADNRKDRNYTNIVGFIVPEIGAISVSDGDTVLVQTSGVMDGFTGLTPGAAVLASINGTITQDVSGFNYYTDTWFFVGTASSSTAILLRIDAGSGTSDINHIGAIIAKHAVAADTDYIACTGQTLNSVTNPEYADLYAAIGITYGGTGPTDFDLPNLTSMSSDGGQMRYQYTNSFPTDRSEAPAYRWDSGWITYPASPAGYTIDISTPTISGTEVPLDEIIINIYAKHTDGTTRKFEAVVHDYYLSSTHYKYGFQASKTAANLVRCTLANDGLAYANGTAYVALNSTDWQIKAVALRSEKFNRFYDYTGDQKLNAMYTLGLRDLSFCNGPGSAYSVTDVTTQATGQFDRGTTDPNTAHNVRLNYDGDLYVSDLTTIGDLSVRGNTTIGNATTDLLTLNGTVNTDIIFANTNRSLWMRPVSGTNIAGANLTIASGQSTGTATSNLYIQTPTPGISGAGVNALATRVTVNSLAVTIEPSLYLSGTVFELTTATPTIRAATQATSITGRDLVLEGGDTVAGALDISGGKVWLRSGNSTGIGESEILFSTVTPQGTSSSTLNTGSYIRMRISHRGIGISNNPSSLLYLKNTTVASGPWDLNIDVTGANRNLTLSTNLTISGTSKIITGVGDTISIGGDFTTGEALTYTGAFGVTYTVTGVTALTLPLDGTVMAFQPLTTTVGGSGRFYTGSGLPNASTAMNYNGNFRAADVLARNAVGIYYGAGTGILYLKNIDATATSRYLSLNLNNADHTLSMSADLAVGIPTTTTTTTSGDLTISCTGSRTVTLAANLTIGANANLIISGAGSLTLNTLGATGVTFPPDAAGTVMITLASSAAGRFYTGAVNPSNTARLNYDGTLYATKFIGAVEGSITGNADTVDLYHVNVGDLNNEVNKLVRTQGNGYVHLGYLNLSNNGEAIQGGSPPVIWGSNGTDTYLRRYSTANLSVSSAALLLANRSNWNTAGISSWSAVVGQLGWNNYGNNHTIFDASKSITPIGTACNNTNPEVNWTATYPTLMGYNGANTYGVRVDSCRVADTVNTINYAGTENAYYPIAWIGYGSGGSPSPMYTTTNLRYNCSNGYTYGNFSSSNPVYGSAFYATSSREKKQNIAEFTHSALKLIDRTKIVNYTFKDDEANTPHIGFIAEDTPVELSGLDQKDMILTDVIGVLIKAVQELQAQIEELRNK